MMLTAQAARATARIAGFGYLAIFVLAIGANFFVLMPLGVSGDAAATAANIAASPLYRAAVAAFMLVLIADIIVGWALFVVLRPAGPNLSLLVLLFRAAYTIAHVGVVLGLLSALNFASGAGAAEALAPTRALLAHHFFSSHGLGFTVTLIFFGVHLVLLGALIARAAYMPMLIGWLVMLAGVAYLADGFATILMGSYGAFADIAALAVFGPAVIGEAALMIWLIGWGVNRARFPNFGAAK